LTEVASLIGAVAALCSTTSFAPQAWKVIVTRDTAAISLKSYLLTVVGFMLWTLYGLVRGDWPLIAANGVCLVLSGFILTMKLLAPADKNKLADFFRSRSD
jgi:MtN3 and saliva related transmembrane protein